MRENIERDSTNPVEILDGIFATGPRRRCWPQGATGSYAGCCGEFHYSRCVLSTQEPRCISFLPNIGSEIRGFGPVVVVRLTQLGFHEQWEVVGGHLCIQGTGDLAVPDQDFF